MCKMVHVVMSAAILYNICISEHDNIDYYLQQAALVRNYCK